jgi:hypothetical protein
MEVGASWTDNATGFQI